MDACVYASDLTDAEWALLASLVPCGHPAGRRQTYPLRRIVDAILYLLRTGAQWRPLPHEYPRAVPFSVTMLSGARTARANVNQVLRESYRCRSGRNPQPTAAIIDREGSR